MSAVLTYDEIKERYPDEWILIADTKLDKKLNIVSGEVIAHSKDRDEVYRKILALKGRSFAVEYNGEPPEEWAAAL
jgi:hypothetical protein